jgi:hypothetical protein
MKRHFVAVLVFLFLVVAANAIQAMPPQAYRMTLGTMYKTQEYVFLIDPLIFLNLSEVKDFVAGLPAGSTLEWAPSDVIDSTKKYPLMYNQEKDLEDYCLKKQVKFVRISPG